MDVSKYLRYTCGRSPDWSRLTDHNQLIGFVEKLKREEVGPEGQLTKLDALNTTLIFLKVVVLADKEHPLYCKATQIQAVIEGWKSTLQKQA